MALANAWQGAVESDKGPHLSMWRWLALAYLSPATHPLVDPFQCPCPTSSHVTVPVQAEHSCSCLRRRRNETAWCRSSGASSHPIHALTLSTPGDRPSPLHPAPLHPASCHPRLHPSYPMLSPVPVLPFDRRVTNKFGGSIGKDGSSMWAFKHQGCVLMLTPS